MSAILIAVVVAAVIGVGAYLWRRRRRHGQTAAAVAAAWQAPTAAAASCACACVGGCALSALVGYLYRVPAAGAAVVQWIDANPMLFFIPMNIEFGKYLGESPLALSQLRALTAGTVAMCQAAATTLQTPPTANDLATVCQTLLGPIPGSNLTMAQMESVYYGGRGPYVSLATKLTVTTPPGNAINPVRAFPGFGPLIAAFDALLLEMLPTLGAVAAAVSA